MILGLAAAVIPTAIAQSPCSCWIEPDGSYTTIDNDSMWNACGVFPNADDAGHGPILLPFPFSFFGQLEDSVFININGNLSFGDCFNVFTSSGFPVDGKPVLAPFWSDVDLEGTGCTDCNLVQYKLTSTALFVNWSRVGYFDSQTDKLNSFQVIITNGADPAVPNGNNVSFCYKDMQWTTGEASEGVGGLGGYPANVGANLGDGINYAQVGRYDHEGVDYDGPFNNNDGVSWLDSTHFYLDVSDTAGVPPIYASSYDCDTIVLEVGQQFEIQMLVIAGGPGETVTAGSTCSTIANYQETGNIVAPLAVVTSTLVPSEVEVGFHTVNYTAQNDDSEPLISNHELVVEVVLNTTEIEAHDGALFTVSPNPAAEQALLSWPAARQVRLIEVVSADGRMVMSERPVNIGRTLLLDMKSVAPGTYLVRASTSEGLLTTRLIKTAY